ncbi:SDR family oxidoreductase [Anaerobacillus sp. MEB173]|uniref:SDR family oxidoreductase n=1 Tax=Anaerobacillus sp. MEB173 TaxID=3383345 RepID=UPI003F91305B
MSNRVVLITGASSGFGLITAIEFAKNGFTVVATMRDMTKENNLINKAKLEGVAAYIHTFSLDVTEFHLLDKRIEQIIQQFGKIDVLVNNAGFALGGFAEDISIGEWKQQFETNVFGVIAVTNAVLPYMRKESRGRIINISSISGRVGFPGLSPYVSSKHALEGYSESLRQEVKPFGIDVSLIEPGSYQTNIWTSGKKVAEKANEQTSPYREMMGKMDRHLDQQKDQLQNPQQVAKLIVKVATVKRPKLRYLIGRGLRFGLVIKTLAPAFIWDKIIQSSIKKLS